MFLGISIHFNPAGTVAIQRFCRRPKVSGPPRPVNSVGFYISSKNDFGVDATIKAYNVLNPTTSDIPILSYRVTDTAGGGANCAGLSLKPPVPCNDAPFLAIDAMSSQFMSVVISTTDTNGFYIDGLSLGAAEEVPEPASVVLIGGGFVLIGIGRKLRARVGQALGLQSSPQS
jgi:hypothetical protein